MLRKSKHSEINMLDGAIFPAMLRFALPVLLSIIFQQLYSTMDSIIVGHTLGETALAAIGAAMPAYDLLLGFALGIGSGLSIVTARNYGSKNPDMVKKSVAGALVIAAVLTLALTVLGLFCLMPFLKILNTPQEILQETYNYSFYIVLFMGVTLAYNLCSGMLQAIGNSVMPLVFLIIASVLNVILDYWFIAGLGMGVEGAAIATVLAQAIAVLLCVIYIGKSVKILIPSRRHFKAEKKLYIEMIAQGLSMGLMQCIVYAGTAILQTGINELGYLVIAGHTTARKLLGFCMIPQLAMIQSVNTFVSQNFGAGKFARIRRAIKLSYLYNAAVTVLVTVVIYCAAPALMQLITGSSESEIIRNGTLYLKVSVPMLVVLGVLNNTRTALQAIGSKILPIVSSVVELAGKFLFVTLLVPKFQYMAVVFCEPVIWVLMTIELLAAFWTNKKIREA